jgi:hypothetical protein
MAVAIRHTRSIHATQALVRATFDDIIPAGDGGCERTVALQNEFRVLLRLTRWRFEAMKADLANWQQRVRSGEADFTPEREDEFKGALRAWIDLASLMRDKFDLFHKKGLFLDNPRYIGLLQSHKKEAENVLDSWQSPEWEVTGMRSVKWDKQQTRHLWTRLGAHE